MWQSDGCLTGKWKEVPIRKSRGPSSIPTYYFISNFTSIATSSLISTSILPLASTSAHFSSHFCSILRNFKDILSISLGYIYQRHILLQWKNFITNILLYVRPLICLPATLALTATKNTYSGNKTNPVKLSNIRRPERKREQA